MVVVRRWSQILVFVLTRNCKILWLRNWIDSCYKFQLSFPQIAFQQDPLLTRSLFLTGRYFCFCSDVIGNQPSLMLTQVWFWAL